HDSDRARQGTLPSPIGARPDDPGEKLRRPGRRVKEPPTPSLPGARRLHLLALEAERFPPGEDPVLEDLGRRKNDAPAQEVLVARQLPETSQRQVIACHRTHSPVIDAGGRPSPSRSRRSNGTMPAASALIGTFSFPGWFFLYGSSKV